MFQNDLLKDKVILVTGGGTGLGFAMSRRFAELGAKLALASRSSEHLETAKKELEAKGAEVHVATCDVRRYDEVDAVVASTVERFGRIDGLVNNAAGNFLAPTEDLSPNAFASVVGIVLQGSFHATHAVGKRMIAQGGGTILSILATYAAENVTGSAFVVPSACAKAGVLALTRSLAVEWARHKIRLNAIAPGAFPTEGAWSRLVPPGVGDDAFGLGVSKIPARRMGEHHELANLAAYLMADGSAYMTGEVVTIDGGRSLMAGTFNELTTLDPDLVIGAMRAMKPSKR